MSIEPLQKARGASAPALTRMRAPLWTVFMAVLVVGMLAAVGSVRAKAPPESFADLADALLPAVVNISTTQSLEGHPGIEEIGRAHV